eukprot:COSAG06_NODE_1781_length_8407_cov_9.719427_4_plen_308_part_00
MFLIISLSAGRPQATGLASLLLLPRRPRRHPLVATPPASAGVSWLQSNASRPTPHPHQAPHPKNRDRAADASRLQRPGPDDHHDHNQDENAARISNCAITHTHTHTHTHIKRTKTAEHDRSLQWQCAGGSKRRRGLWLLAAGCWLLAAGCWLLAAGCWLTGSSDLLPGLDATATAAGEGGAWPVAKACWVASCCAATEGSSICPCGRSSTSDAASANCHAAHTHTASERASDDAECGTLLVSAAAAHSRSGGEARGSVVRVVLCCCVTCRFSQYSVCMYLAEATSIRSCCTCSSVWNRKEKKRTTRK